MQDVSLNLVESFDDATNFFRWLGERRTWLAVDTETGGLDWWRDPLRLVQIGDAQTGWAIPWDQWGGIAKEAIEKYEGVTAMHNSKFDLHMLESNGVRYPRQGLHDTMPMVGLIEPTKLKGLKPASERLVGKGAALAEKALRAKMSKNKWTWATVPVDLPEYWAYSALDVVLTSRLAETMYPRLSQENLSRAYEVEVAVAQVLCDMERAGVGVDLDYARKISNDLEREGDTLYQWFQTELGIKSPRSDKQLITWFQQQGYQFTTLTERGNISLDGTVLEEVALNRPDLAAIADGVSRLRDYHKMKVTYFDAFIEFADGNDRIHTSINPMKAITARMSSERPNLQNIPARKHGKLVRDCFVPAKGHKFIAVDFDQIEYRIMVSRAGEQQLIDAINAGQDLHTYMTSVVYSKPYDDVQPAERSVMKNATFAFLYGAGDMKFAQMAGITLEQAVGFRNLYTTRFPAIASYADQVDQIGRQQGHMTTPYLGRKQGIRDPNKSYKLLNYVTQGEAGDVLKQKMVELSMTDAGQYMRLPIHDEIIFEVPEGEVDYIGGVISETMPENNHFQVPLSVGVEVVDRWGDKYK